MKILQINCVYKVGSTGNIMFDIHKCLREMGHESVVIYGRGETVEEEKVYKSSTEFEGKIHSVFSKLFGMEYAYSRLSTDRAINIIKKERPDVVHLHCLNGHFINIYRILEFLKKSGIKTVISLHAEMMYTAGCSHAMDCEKWKTECYSCPKIKGYISTYFRDDARHCYDLIKTAYKDFNNLIIVGVSQWVTNRAKQSPMLKDNKFKTITNGINTDVFQAYDATILRKKLNIPDDKKIILHVSPNVTDALKGVDNVIELANRMKDYQFIVIGEHSDRINVPENVMTVSHIKNQVKLAEYYSLADCFVMTSSRETYPTVCIEAIACGCNVVGFNVGGVPETIPDGMGETVEAFDMDAFEKAVRKWADIKASKEYIKKLHYDLSRQEMTRKYVEVYKEF